jgi:hypothetical protein
MKINPILIPCFVLVIWACGCQENEWDYVGNPRNFDNYVKTEVEQFLNE